MDDICGTTKPLILKSDVATNNMQRHTPRIEIRPINLPEDVVLLSSPPTEKNSRNVGNVNSDKFCNNPTFEELNRKDTLTTVCSKFNVFDQQIPHKTRGQQREQNNLTAKTAVIVPSALQEKVTVSVRISGDHSSGATQPNTPARSAREVSERGSSDSCPLTLARAPRTLQPLHWTTFYKPHTPSNVRGTEERPASPSASTPPSTAHTPLSQVEKPVPDADSTSACPSQPGGKPKENSEEHGLPDVNPTCQRPRLKRMQQFEDLDDEIPQFV
ncbi:Hypothetical predicted protein [Marmota monax]|uniref:Uncharacterized protein n=1 Tax=Marmota monax TaxID=9995 RepID=A0A5E4CYT8_MARMO|nr:Hypothetical predicted protein [Marmota monax]